MNKQNLISSFSQLGTTKPNDQTTTSTQQDIMGVYEQFPDRWFTQTELSDGLKKHQGVVNNNLRKLVKQGLLVRQGKPYRYGLVKKSKTQ